MSTHNPTIETHVPVTVDIPEEATDLLVGRPDIPPPSLWQHAVEVTHRTSGKRAVVARMDWSTNMFRAYYPDEGERDATGRPAGRFAERSEWEHCREWKPSVTLSPKELARQAAREQLEKEIAKLDARGLAAVSVLCDDPEPAKALAKLEALRHLGVVQVSSEAAQMAVAEVKKGGGK
jgi:hypothetical protein